MKVGELRKLLEALTDDTNVMVDNDRVIVEGAGARHTHIIGRGGFYKAVLADGGAETYAPRGDGADL